MEEMYFFPHQADHIAHMYHLPLPILNQVHSMQPHDLLNQLIKLLPHSNEIVPFKG
jgi:hypothetical protein